MPKLNYWQRGAEYDGRKDSTNYPQKKHLLSTYSCMKVLSCESRKPDKKADFAYSIIKDALKRVGRAIFVLVRVLCCLKPKQHSMERYCEYTTLSWNPLSHLSQ